MLLISDSSVLSFVAHLDSKCGPTAGDGSFPSSSPVRITAGGTNDKGSPSGSPKNSSCQTLGQRLGIYNCPMLKRSPHPSEGRPDEVASKVLCGPSRENDSDAETKIGLPPQSAELVDSAALNTVMLLANRVKENNAHSIKDSIDNISDSGQKSKQGDERDSAYISSESPQSRCRLPAPSDLQQLCRTAEDSDQGSESMEKVTNMVNSRDSSGLQNSVAIDGDAEKGEKSQMLNSENSDEAFLSQASMSLTRRMSSKMSGGGCCNLGNQSYDSDQSEREISLLDHLSPNPQHRQGRLGSNQHQQENNLSNIDEIITELKFSQDQSENSPGRDTNSSNILKSESENLKTDLPENSPKRLVHLARRGSLTVIPDERILTPNNELLFPEDSSDVKISVKPHRNRHLKYKLHHAMDSGPMKDSDDEPSVKINGWCEQVIPANSEESSHGTFRDFDFTQPLQRLRSNTIASKTVHCKPFHQEVAPNIQRCESAAANLHSLMDSNLNINLNDFERNLMSFDSTTSLNKARFYTIHDDTAFKQKSLLDRSLEDLNFKCMVIHPQNCRQTRRRLSTGSLTDLAQSDFLLGTDGTTLVEEDILLQSKICKSPMLARKDVSSPPAMDRIAENSA